MSSYKLKYLLHIILFALMPAFSAAQNNLGMATGNYAGISGLWMNPANVVDSRYKFDINIIGLNSYYDNNYLLVKNSALVRRIFYKSPYSSSFADVKKDLLQEGSVTGKVYANTTSNIQFPLSFMVTTGKRSAIALTMANRTINKLDSVNPATAKLFFDELQNPLLYNTAMNNDGLRYNFLNWQEVGLTYGRVIIGKGNIFLKAAVTGKWLGAGAAGFIQADKLSITFKDNKTVSMNSPLIRYGRTSTADLGQFQRKNIFNNIEDQTWGIDAGIVFEVRTRLKRFKYVDEDDKEQLRRDKNKYIFRLGVSVVDVGEFTFNRKPLTNDHSASFVDWNFANVRANNLSDLDTAYSQQVNFIAGSPSTFTYRLPAAVIVNFDLHLFSGFYINVAAKQPLADYGNKASTHLRAERWAVITPRFESKFFGIYVPVSRVNSRTNIGATVKLGPFYAGSNNLSEILSNEKTYEADFHLGMRLSILQGKPPKLLSNARRLVDEDDIREQRAVQSRLDSLSREVEMLKRKYPDSSHRPVINVIIQNNDGQVQSKVSQADKDSIVIKNNAKSIQGNAERARTDTTTEFLLRQLATNQVEIKKLKEERNEGATKGKKKKQSEANTEDIEKELASIKNQMILQNAALAAAAVVSKNKKDTVAVKKDSVLNNTIMPQGIVDSVNHIRDTVSAGNPVPGNKSAERLVIKNDTLMIRDTVIVHKEKLIAGLPQYQPLYFETNQTALSDESVAQLKKVVTDLATHPTWKIEISGRTDPSGSMAANQKVANARVAAVRNGLIKEGIAANRIFSAIGLGNSGEKNLPGQRRVDLVILEK